MLGGDCALVHIGFAVKFPLHGSPAVRKGVSAGADILGHVHGGALEVIPHYIGQLFYAHFLAGEYKQREISLKIPAHYVVHIAVGIPGDGITLLVVE